MRRMCPRCGREDSVFVENLCAKCYVETKGLSETPKRIDFLYCRGCGSYRVQGVWVEGGDSIEDALIEYIQVFLPTKIRPTYGVKEVWISSINLPQNIPPSGLVDVRLEVSGRIEGIVLKEDKLIKVKIETGLCPICFKRKTKSGFRGIVQVRTLTGELSERVSALVGEVLRELEAKVSSAIIAVEDHKHGVDILVTDQSIARVIAYRIKASSGGLIKESYKLSGVDSRGKRISILSISIRIPDIRPGEEVILGGKTYKVISLNSDGAILEDVDSGEIKEYTYEKLVGLKRVKTTHYKA